MEKTVEIKSTKSAKLQLESIAKKIKVPDLKKYSGIIELKTDPLEFQKEIRNEWH